MKLLPVTGFVAANVLLCVTTVAAQAPTQAKSAEESDPAVAAIITAARTDNQVQKHLDYLTNRIGPRLTGSEGLQAGCEWARDKFASMGLKARLEKWGEFPVGFERGPSSGAMVSPKKMVLDFGTNAWSAGTQGRVGGEVMIAPRTVEDVQAARESIEGNYVLIKPPARRRRRRSPAKKADATDQKKKAAAKNDAQTPLTREQYLAVKAELLKCQPAGLIRSTSGELILTGGSYRITMDTLPTVPEITLLKTQFDEIQTLVKAGEKVELSFDIRNHFRKGPIPLYNVIADIPGSEWPEQCVVVGGHIDSWDGATGATDNGAGCATTIEAARILMAAKVKPKRTIRFMLWSGEEQGLLGSRAFVGKHKEDVQKNVSAVFVHDGGTNYVAGLRCTKAMKADFDAVFAPVKTLNPSMPFDIAEIKSMYPRGGSDHVPFIAAGVPGFFWSQRGRATYRTTHHTQYDTFESVVPEYQEHSSMVIAVGAYGTANLDHLLPREGVVGRR